MYSLLALTGMRFGEVAALRWKRYESDLKPLGKLLVITSYSTRLKTEKKVKTEVSRHVPVHQVLASILDEWYANGWANLIGRKPTQDDLIIPSRKGCNRSSNHCLKRLHQDLKRHGLRKRRQHDLRRSFISLARQDGAREDVLKWITHGRPEGIINVYTELPWELRCQEIAKIKMHLLEQPETPGEAGGGVLSEESPLADTQGDRLQWELQPGFSGCNPLNMKEKRRRGGRDSNP
jgi:integrase